MAEMITEVVEEDSQPYSSVPHGFLQKNFKQRGILKNQNKIKLDYLNLQTYISMLRIDLVQFVPLILRHLLIKSMNTMIYFVYLAISVGVTILSSLLMYNLANIIAVRFFTDANLIILWLIVFVLSGAIFFTTYMYFILFFNQFPDERMWNMQIMKFKTATKNEILHRIDLRTFAGDDDILASVVSHIDDMNDTIFGQILRIILIYIPIIIYLIWNNTINLSVVISMMNEDTEDSAANKLLNAAISLYEGEAKQEEIKLKVNFMYQIMKKSLIVGRILIAIFILSSVLPLIFLDTNIVSPQEYAVGIATNIEGFHSCGIYDASQVQLQKRANELLRRTSYWSNSSLCLVVFFTLLASACIVYLINQVRMIGVVMDMEILSPLFLVLQGLSNMPNLGFLGSILQVVRSLSKIFIAAAIIGIIYAGVISVIISFATMHILESSIYIIVQSLLALGNMTIDRTYYHPLSVHTESIVFRSASVGYIPSANILEDINLTISPGKIILIFGISGAGKTTLLHAIRGNIYINEGQVTIHDKANSQQLSKVQPTDRRQLVGVVPQVLKFKSDGLNVKEYLERSNPYASEAEMINMLVQLKLVENSEEGSEFLQRKMGTEALVFSGGQRSRLALCASMLQNPFIQLIDEALDNLDKDTTAKIVSVLCGPEFASKHVPVIITHKILQIIEQIYVQLSIEAFKNIYIWYVNDGKVEEISLVNLIKSGRIYDMLKEVIGEDVNSTQYTFLNVEKNK